MSQQRAVDEKRVIDGSQATSKADAKQTKQARQFSQTDGDGQVSMGVKIHSPFRSYYDGPALSLSAENATGPFDILPHHHNFISLLLPCELIVRPPEGGERKVLISGGVMHVKADQVTVFLDI